ncbi:ATP-binding cassette permease mdl1, partial [Bonamia ostreae]
FFRRKTFFANGRRVFARIDHGRLFCTKQKHKQVNFEGVLKILKPHSGLLCIAFAGLGVSAAVTMALPAAFGYVIDNIEKKHSSEKRYKIFAGLGVMFLFGGLGVLTRIFFFNLASEKIIFSLRKKIMSNVLKKKIEFFENVRSGDIVTRLNSDVVIMGKSFAGENLSSGARKLVTLFGSFVLMIYISPKLTAATLVIPPLIFASSRIYGRLVKRITKLIQKELGNSTSIADESISNIQTVKIFNRQKFENEKYKEAIERVFKASKKAITNSSIYSSAVNVVGNSVLLSILVYGSHLCTIGEITVGTLTSFLFYSLYVGISGMGLVRCYTDFMRGIGASTRVFELINGEDLRRTSLRPENPFKEKPFDITFEKIKFSYPSRMDNVILNRIDLNFSHGKKYAIIGESGSGKSTIISLIIRFYRPLEGRILFGDKDINSLPASTSRNSVGVVTQTLQFFSGTVLENLCYGIDGECQSFKEMNEKYNAPVKVIEAAKTANAHYFIKLLPEQYHTKIGTNNALFSGGEKQRIAFARALLCDPPVFLFDE